MHEIQIQLPPMPSPRYIVASPSMGVMYHTDHPELAANVAYAATVARIAGVHVHDRVREN